MAHKILLIDDDKGVVEVVKNLLVEKGFKVFTAFDGKEGIEMVASEQPDLILLDIRMPTMNGYEFIRSLRSQKVSEGKPMLPVIMLTGIEEMREVFNLEGAQGYITKPVDSSTLIQKVEECLSSND